MKKVKAWEYLSSMPEIPGRDDLANAIITSLDYNVYVIMTNVGIFRAINPCYAAKAQAQHQDSRAVY